MPARTLDPKSASEIQKKKEKERKRREKRNQQIKDLRKKNKAEGSSASFESIKRYTRRSGTKRHSPEYMLAVNEFGKFVVQEIVKELCEFSINEGEGKKLRIPKFNNDYMKVDSKPYPNVIVID